MVMYTVEEDYRAVCAYLFVQFPQYQRIGSGAYKSGLEGMADLDRLLEHPHTRFRSIHVAGTNGKGSVSHMLAAILQEAGYRTGLYTSPHLFDFRERIRINGVMISQEAVLSFVEQYRSWLDEWKPSFFEITTAMAFDYFAQQKVDIAVIETGLGGRLDATNIIQPAWSVITNIGLDHCEYLGNTLASIAAEKGGIIKANTPVVIGERDPQTDPVFIQKAREMRAPLYFAEDAFKDRWKEYPTDLAGLYQQKNIPVVLQALDLFRPVVPEAAIKTGIKYAARLTGLRGRWECIAQNPRVIVDAAHNAHGLKWAVAQLQREPYQKLHIVLGVVVEKDLRSILPILPKDASYYFTQAQIPRALDAYVLAEQCKKEGLYGVIADKVPEALTTAIKNAHADDLIFVGGSIFVVAEALATNNQD